MAEDDMELLSDIVTWGEMYLNHWEDGVYTCSRCHKYLYHSRDKFIGPCVWPSFRSPVTEDAISTRVVYPYNNYEVTVMEVYCNNCNLFIGHQFEDGVEKGDAHADAHWRH
jgi:peptide-methionine (R)-S-oxide reductase